MTSQNVPDPKKSKALMQRIRPATILLYGWVLVLSIGVLISAQSAYRQSLNTEEYAYACDSFGYLRMAKEIRQAAYRRGLPPSHPHSSHTPPSIHFIPLPHLS